MNPAVVAVERTIAAPPNVIFDLLADPFKHPEIDGSGSVREIMSTAPRLAKGVKFAASMRIGVPYRVTNTVVEFIEGRQIAWRHQAGVRWRYVLTPVAKGTLVREEWDPSRVPSLAQRALAAVGYPERAREGMEQTLHRLEDLVTESSRTSD